MPSLRLITCCVWEFRLTESFSWDILWVRASRLFWRAINLQRNSPLEDYYSYRLMHLFQVFLLIESSSIDAALGYPMVPILYPFSLSSVAAKYVKLLVKDQWNSQINIQNVTSPILIMHGSQDYEIQVWQAKALVSAALSNKSQKHAVRTLPGEGELWIADALWYLEVLHGGHNTLSSFQVVVDTIDAWLVHNSL